ncbi:ribokinase [Oceanobacillus jeddahense]|uniref:Ribokinase n=1 Tax=Oceanobacillus jeddahense TaxID=1462527 RepID=A0ABY5JV16_9BACI|nr:ribokinase [Oceanobacillus jeddahense]UUI04205.1 ribokinase [Oceanobacillus jeddahense]
MKRKPRVCVVGSINMDMVTTTDKMPEQGETILGESFTTHPGGKGANQAIAAARLGADVVMVGAVGDDAFGNSLKARFRNEGANDEAIITVPHESTGVATIILSDGDNRIIVAPGANKYVTPEMVKEKQNSILSSDIVLMQFEVPMETIEYTVELAHKHDIPVVINPAPFNEIPENVVEKATFITPNESELSAMEQSIDTSSIKLKIIETRGEQGVAFTLAEGKEKTIPSFKAKVKDTTGAGDTFNGAFVTEYVKEKDVEKAIRFANAAASLAVEKIGAQEGMPKREDVVKRMR